MTTHTHTHATIKEKEARDSKGECMVGTEERKRKGEMIYIIISKKVMVIKIINLQIYF